MSETLKLDEDVARGLAYCQAGEQHGGYEVVENLLEDITRWNTVNLLVIKKIGELGFWGTRYERGATEYNSEEPFECSEPTFHRIKPVPVQTVRWFPAE